MRRLVAVLIVALLLSLAALPGASGVAGQTGEPRASGGYIYRSENPIPGQYLVVLNNNDAGSELADVAGQLAAAYNGVLLSVPYREGVNGFSAQMSEADALALSLDARVGYVEEIPESGFQTETPETGEIELQLPEATPTPDETEGGDGSEELFETLTIGGGGVPVSGDTVQTDSKGAVSNLVSPLPTPSEPLSKPADPKTLYFRYGNPTEGFKTIALFGMSGSFLPHVRRLRDWDLARWGYNPIKENCTLDNVGTGASQKAKYKFCIDSLLSAGLNHLQIWVTLNHSVGMTPRERRRGAPSEKQPYPNEQPFKWDGSRWSLNVVNTTTDNFDTTFFSNLRNVVSYCQTKGIVVAVVLFDPWSGWNDNPADGPVNQPIYGAWYSSNNTAPAYTNGVGFTNPYDFVMATDPNATPDQAFIDPAGPNRFLRNVQVAVMQRTAKELSGLNNFYWVLANEPDIHGKAVGKRLITWHRYMARRLREYERGLPGNKPHLVAANLASRLPDNGTAEDDVLEGLTKNLANADLNLDIVTGHYVHLKGRKGSLTEGNRFSAIKLLNAYNAYTAGGAPVLNNTKRWGFSEGRPTGTLGDYPDPLDPTRRDPLTADAARVEAWEFFMNGGALFDHLSYKWANPDGDNETTPPKVLNYYKLLSGFMNNVPLDGMKRMTLNQTNKWINDPPAYGSPYWAAMSNGSTVFLFYLHRSTLAGINFDRYDVYRGTPATWRNFTVQNLGCGDFRADWYYPDGKAVNGVGAAVNGALTPFGGFDFRFSSTTATRLFQTPSFRQDIVLKITRVAPRTCTP